MIPESEKQLVKQNIRADELYAELFPDHVRPGTHYMCVWHGDGKKPSLAKHADYMRCFGACAKSYDAYDIWMKASGSAFEETHEALMKRVTNGSGRDKPRPAGREPKKNRVSYTSMEAGLKANNPVCSYYYRKSDGTLAFLVMRFKDKTFKPLHEEPDGRWHLDMGEGPNLVPRILLSLPELLSSDPTEPIVLCEGEKDVQTAQRIGFVATTNPGGSGAWKRLCQDDGHLPLKDRIVWAFPDCDDAGGKWAKDLRDTLPGIVQELRIVRLPNSEEISGYDLSDYVADVGEDNAYGLIMELIEDTKPEAPKQDQKTEKKHTTPVTISFYDLSQAEIEDPRMVVDRILSEGLALWCGAPKSCKSWQMIQMATAVSQGGLFLGEFPCTQGDVLCLTLEDNERRLAKRLKMQLQGEPAPRNAYLATQWPMFRETKKNEIDGLGHLHRFIEEHPQTRLVIIDTLAKVRQRRKKEGNLYGQDYEDLEQLQQMASLYGIAIVLVHHTNKGQHQDEFNTISGSTGLSGCADTIAILRKPRGATEGELFISGRDVEEIRGSLSFDPDTGLWTWNGTVAEAKSSQEREEILEVMKSVGLPMKPKDVHEKLGGTRTLNAIQQAMIRMRASGSLESSARGKGWYVVAPPPFPTH